MNSQTHQSSSANFSAEGLLLHEASPAASAAPIHAGHRSTDLMTVDDLWRARAIAAVLGEARMVRKLDAELRTIYATHTAIQNAKRARGVEQ